MCSSWRPIGDVLQDVIGRLECQRQAGAQWRNTLDSLPPSAATREGAGRNGNWEKGRELVTAPASASGSSEVLPATHYGNADRSMIAVYAHCPQRRVAHSAAVIDLAVYREARGH